MSPSRLMRFSYVEPESAGGALVATSFLGATSRSVYDDVKANRKRISSAPSYL